MWPEVAQNSRAVSGSGQNSEVSGSNQAKTMLFLLFFSSEIVKTAGRPAGHFDIMSVVWLSTLHTNTHFHTLHILHFTHTSHTALLHAHCPTLTTLPHSAHFHTTTTLDSPEPHSCTLATLSTLHTPPHSSHTPQKEPHSPHFAHFHTTLQLHFLPHFDPIHTNSHFHTTHLSHT